VLHMMRPVFCLRKRVWGGGGRGGGVSQQSLESAREPLPSSYAGVPPHGHPTLKLADKKIGLHPSRGVQRVPREPFSSREGWGLGLGRTPSPSLSKSLAATLPPQGVHPHQVYTGIIMLYVCLCRFRFPFLSICFDKSCSRIIWCQCAGTTPLWRRDGAVHGVHPLCRRHRDVPRPGSFSPPPLWFHSAHPIANPRTILFQDTPGRGRGSRQILPLWFVQPKQKTVEKKKLGWIDVPCFFPAPPSCTLLSKTSLRTMKVVNKTHSYVFIHSAAVVQVPALGRCLTMQAMPGDSHRPGLGDYRCLATTRICFPAPGPPKTSHLAPEKFQASLFK